MTPRSRAALAAVHVRLQDVSALRVCSRYEEALRTRTPIPGPEAFLPDAPAPQQDELLAALLVVDLTVRLERGEQPDPSEYRRRFPRHHQLLAEAFAALRDESFHDAVTASRGEPAQHPERLGPYRIVRERGRGGMGVIYEAVHEPLQRRVALKLLLGCPHPDAEQLRR